MFEEVWDSWKLALCNRFSSPGTGQVSRSKDPCRGLKLGKQGLWQAHRWLHSFPMVSIPPCFHECFHFNVSYCADSYRCDECASTFLSRVVLTRCIVCYFLWFWPEGVLLQTPSEKAQTMPCTTAIMGPAVRNQILNLTPSLLHLNLPLHQIPRAQGPELRSPAWEPVCFPALLPSRKRCHYINTGPFLRVEGLLLLEPICFLHMWPHSLPGGIHPQDAEGKVASARLEKTTGKS